MRTAWRRIVSESAAAKTWFQIPFDISADALVVQIGNSLGFGKQGGNERSTAAFVAVRVCSIVEAIVNEAIREALQTMFALTNLGAHFARYLPERCGASTVMVEAPHRKELMLDLADNPEPLLTDADRADTA
jgi:hypothetical protein